MLSERLAAGLTREDIRLYWNQPPLMQRLQARAQDFVIFLIIKNAEESGVDPIETIRNRRKIYLHLGDPKTWDSTKPVNKGFSSEDADIYPEFTMRVGIWSNGKTPAQQAELLSKHTSFNAMIRSLVRQGLV